MKLTFYENNLNLSPAKGMNASLFSAIDLVSYTLIVAIRLNPNHYAESVTVISERCGIIASIITYNYRPVDEY